MIEDHESPRVSAQTPTADVGEAHHAGDLVVPTISTSVMGPIGIAHLPRLWQKLLLHACGRLPPGYRHGIGGFDGHVCETLGLDAAALIAFVETTKPQYPAFETWVNEHARDLRPATIAALNTRLRTMDMPEPKATEVRARLAIQDESFGNGIALNDLDDWATFHEVVLAKRASSA